MSQNVKWFVFLSLHNLNCWPIYQIKFSTIFDRFFLISNKKLQEEDKKRLHFKTVNIFMIQNSKLLGGIEYIIE